MTRDIVLSEDIILKEIIDIGQAMLECGAEVSRCEDSMKRMCRAYNARQADLFILTSCIMATVQWQDGRMVTQIRMVKTGTMDFDKLDYLNDLSRYVVAHKPNEEELASRFQDVMHRKSMTKPAFYIGSVLIAAGFCVFYGGTMIDALAAGIISLFVMYISRILQRLEDNAFVKDFVLSFLVGFLSDLSSGLGLVTHPSSITIGCIMLLISGLGITNGIRDVLHRDIMSGFLRVTSACMGAAAIACGIMLAMIIFRRV
ncbi:MAG: threonine/serine exporter family protein [Eubacterium sp.]